MRIEKVYIRPHGRHAFAMSATWLHGERDFVKDADGLIALPAAAMDAGEEDFANMVRTGTRIVLRGHVPHLAKFYQVAPEEIEAAIDAWPGDYTLS